MNRKEKKIAKAKVRQEKIRRKQERLRQAGRFKKWQKRRPFWGATLTLLAGLLILWIPIHLYMLAFAPGNFAIVGLMFGGLIAIIGVMAYIYPQFSTVFGVFTIFLSVFSIMGALGGFVVGTVIGLIGGALCIGWKPEVIPSRANREWSQEAKAIEGGKVQTAVGQNQAPEPERREKTMKPTGSTRVINSDNEVASAVEKTSDSAKIIHERNQEAK